MTLTFPFVVVTHAESIFGGIPNFEEVVEACPPDFYRSNSWSAVAMHLYHHGITKSQVATWKFKTLDKVIANLQLAYLRAWLKSLRPLPSVKEAVCGWLLSKMLKECPHSG